MDYFATQADLPERSNNFCKLIFRLIGHNLKAIIETDGANKIHILYSFLKSGVCMQSIIYDYDYCMRTWGSYVSILQL